MNSKKNLLNFLIFILFLAAIPVLIIVVQRVVEMRSRAAGSGTMTLSLVGSSPAVGTDFDVQLYVSTAIAAPFPKSRGVDVVLTFPKDRLQLQSITTNAASGASAILKLFVPVSPTTYNFDSTTVIANANSSGTLSFGAVPVELISPLPPSPTPPYRPGTTDSFAGSLLLATLKFRAVTAGNAAINFVPSAITANTNNDSNIASYDLTGGAATDLLGSVTNLPLTVGGTVTNTPTPGTGTSSCPAGCTKGSLGNLDCSTDGIIGAYDLMIMANEWNVSPVPTKSATRCSADIAGSAVSGGGPDGTVDAYDLFQMANNWSP